MYASIRRYKMNPGSVDELMRRVNEGFVPLVSLRISKKGKTLWHTTA